MLRRIDINEFNHIYEKIKSSFPSFRVRNLDDYDDYFKEEKYQCFVCENDGKEVGFVMGYIFQNVKSKDYPRRFGFFHLDYLCIYEEYRNQGYGTKLFEELLDEPFTKKGIFFVLPMEEKYEDDKNDPYYERIGNDSYYRFKRFFDRFSQKEISHYRNEKKFVYIYPGSDNKLHPMHLHLIKGFDVNNPKELNIYYDQFAILLKESEDYIHQKNPLKEKAYLEYKDIIINNTAPYYIAYNHYDLLKIDLNSLENLQDIKSFVINGDKTLYSNLFNDGYLPLETFKELLTRNTIFNEKNILALYFGDNGKYYGLTEMIIFSDEYPKNNKEEILNAYKNTNIEIPKGFDKAMDYLELFKNKMIEGERRILFISKGNSYYSHFASETDLITKLPKGYNYVIEIEKDDLFKILSFTKFGFKVRKEYDKTIELSKKI